MKGNTFLDCHKMRRSPMFTTRHKHTGVPCVCNHNTWTDKWLIAPYNDENKPYLNDLDNCAYCKHNIREEPRTLFSRQQ